MFERLKYIYDQFTRYGTVYNEKILDILDVIAEINDDFYHDRDVSEIQASIHKAKKLLDQLAEAE